MSRQLDVLHNDRVTVCDQDSEGFRINVVEPDAYEVSYSYRDIYFTKKQLQQFRDLIEDVLSRASK